MALTGLLTGLARSARARGHRPGAWRRVARRARRVAAMVTAPVTGAGSVLVPVSVVAAGAAAISVVSAAVAPVAARASTQPSVLILGSSVNGGTSSTEYQQAFTQLGYSVTVATDSQWPTENFSSFNAIVLGDPSTSSNCSATVPSEALTTRSTWEPSVQGNVAIIGTAPAFANENGATGAATLIRDAIAYAASGSKTGLYVSLNCEDQSDGAATQIAGTSTTLLYGIEGIGTAGGLTDTGQHSACPAGTVNAQEMVAAAGFNSLTTSALSGWPSPSCGAQETLNTWPGWLTPVAYVAGSSLVGGASSADWTSSSGASGQPSVLLGTAPSSGTQGLAPSTNGQVPPGSAVGGSNPAAPGVTAAMAADPVNTENGDFTQSAIDLSIPTFGPGLGFSRTYDAQLAQQQATAGSAVPVGSPGSLGYGWTDNWDTWLSAGRTTPGDIYTIDGLRTSTGNTGPATAAAENSPGSVAVSNGNVYFADTQGNRIEEVAGALGTQWGIPMTAGNVYTILGSDTGQPATSGGCSNGTAMGSCKIKAPQGVTVDSSGDLFVADTGDNRVLMIPAANGNYYGINNMTADDVYTVAGNVSGNHGHTGDGGLASNAYLSGPTQVVLGTGGDTSLYIADAGNNRVQEVFQTGGEKWGQSMSANDIYTVAGQQDGSGGNNGAGGPAISAFLTNPESVSISSGGDLYIAVTGNNKIQEVPSSTGAQWGLGTLTANDIYNIVGAANGTLGLCPNNTLNTSSSCLLYGPTGVIANNGTQLYITDAFNSRIAELARTTHSEWNISMTANYLYNIAGSAAGTTGHSGDGGVATAALMCLGNLSGRVGFSSAGMYVADSCNNEVRLVSSTSPYNITDFAGGAGTFAQDGNGGTAVNAGLFTPQELASDSHGDIFVADGNGQRVQELSAWNHTQFAIAMKPGDVYTVAGSPAGFSQCAGPGVQASATLLCEPGGVAVDPSGNLYIADTANNRVEKVSASNGSMSTFAGSPTGVRGNPGSAGQGNPPTQVDLTGPQAVAADSAGDVFITSDNQVFEVPAASGTQYGISMTAGDIYTITGSQSGASGYTGSNGPAVSALLNSPVGVAVDAAGNVYVGDGGNWRVAEIAAAAHTQWGVAMTANDFYVIAGGHANQQGSSGDGGPATAAQLGDPSQVAVDSAGDLYIADAVNNKIREVAAASGTQWSQNMTGADIYTVAGTGAQGSTTDGIPATSSILDAPPGITVDPSGDLFLTNSEVGSNTADRLQEIVATSGPLFATDPGPGAAWSASGITITQPGGSQVTFYPQQNGACPSSGSTSTAPYTQVAGGYCTLPEYAGATLTYSTSHGGQFTFTPSPGLSYVYGSSGALTGETDAAGDQLSLTYGTAPGSGNCPASAVVCTTITSASGRSLVIGYDSNGLLTSVTDPNVSPVREWQYGHAGSDLTSVTDPMNNVTTYGYDSGNASPVLQHDMTTITSPDAQPGYPGLDADPGAATVNVYDSLGRVTKQTDPMGYVTTFNYCVNAATGNCMDAATGTGYVTVADPDGNNTIYGYTAGQLTSQADWTGAVGTGTLTSESDSAPDQATDGTAAAGTQLDLAAADGTGKVTTYGSYDQYGSPAAITDPLGYQTTQHDSAATFGQPDCTSVAEAGAGACTNSPGPAPVNPGQVITPPTTAPPQGETWTLYDKLGNELYLTTGVYQPGASSASYLQTTYRLFNSDQVTLPNTSTAITCAVSAPSPSLPCATINADGVVTQLGYDAQGDLTSSSTPDGNANGETATTTYSYDGDGEQTSMTSPDGNLTGANAGNYTTLTTWNGDRQETAVTEGGGTGHTVTPRTTNYGYDGNGNQATVQDPRGYTTTTTYNADNQATLIQNPDNNLTLTCYDGVGNVTQTVPPVGVAANSLGASSCPTSYPGGYDPSRHMLASDATMYTFNVLGQQTAQYTPLPSGQSGPPNYETTTYIYDGNGNVLSTTAPPAINGGPSQVTTDSYTADGHLSTETNWSGSTALSTVSYCYDANGDRTSVVYADGNTGGVAPCNTNPGTYPWIVDPTAYPAQAHYQTTYSYDSAAELVSVTTSATTAAPNGATTTSTYDAAGNTLTRTDPMNVITTWTYTPLNQAATISYSGGSAHSVSYQYFADGHRKSMSDATGNSSYQYDPFGELTSVTNGANQTTGYGYNADGEVSSVTYPLPAGAIWATTPTVNYTYDTADLLTQVTDFNNNAITISLNADGLPKSVGLGSTSDTIATTYDNTDEPSAITLKNGGGTTLQSFAYSDSPAGTILNETDTPASSQSPAVYSYDAKSRVTTMTPGTGPALNYSFDASSNLTTLPTGATSTNYDYAGELTSATLSGTTTTYAYNADGQRLTAKQGSTTITSGTWNGAGQLTSYSDPAANMTSASYDGNGLRATATTGAATQTFVWDTVAPTPQLIMDSGNAYIYCGGFVPAEQVNLSSGAITYVVTDLLGSIRGAVNNSGTLTGTTNYDAWGNPESPGGLTATTPFGFAGGYTDPTGLSYLINRYYEPATGQFISVDPALTSTLQPYAYASSDPVSNSDPTGLSGGRTGIGVTYHYLFLFKAELNYCLDTVIGRFCYAHISTGVYFDYSMWGLFVNHALVERILGILQWPSGAVGAAGHIFSQERILKLFTVAAQRDLVKRYATRMGWLGVSTYILCGQLWAMDKLGGHNGVIVGGIWTRFTYRYHIPVYGVYDVHSGWALVTIGPIPVPFIGTQNGVYAMPLAPVFTDVPA